jgi:hypothetical protein
MARDLVITMSYFNSTTTMLLRCRPPLQRTISSTRGFHISPYHLQRDLFDPNSVERVADDVDVCIVGGGPAGLSAAIRLKQLEKEKGKEVRVVVLEKGAEVGESCYFILSGERRAGLFVEGPSWLHNRVFCRDLGCSREYSCQIRNYIHVRPLRSVLFEQSVGRLSIEFNRLLASPITSCLVIGMEAEINARCLRRIFPLL